MVRVAPSPTQVRATFSCLRQFEGERETRAYRNQRAHHADGSDDALREIANVDVSSSARSSPRSRGRREKDRREAFPFRAPRPRFGSWGRRRPLSGARAPRRRSPPPRPVPSQALERTPVRTQRFSAMSWSRFLTRPWYRAQMLLRGQRGDRCFSGSGPRGSASETPPSRGGRGPSPGTREDRTPHSVSRSFLTQSVMPRCGTWNR